MRFEEIKGLDKNCVVITYLKHYLFFLNVLIVLKKYLTLINVFDTEFDGYWESEGERKREREREGEGARGWERAREGGRVDYIEKTSILALFYTFIEIFILTLLLFVQSWKKLLPFAENAYWID